MTPSCKRDQSPGFSVFAFCSRQINAATGMIHRDLPPPFILDALSCNMLAQLRLFSSPAACDTTYSLERQEKVFDMFFSCAWEKCIICPINLVIYWTDKLKSCEPPQNQVGYVPAIILHNAPPFIFLFKSTLYRRQMKSWNSRIPHCFQHSLLLAKLVPVTVEDKWDYFKTAGINYEYKCDRICYFTLPLLTHGRRTKTCVQGDEQDKAKQ